MHPCARTIVRSPTARLIGCNGSWAGSSHSSNECGRCLLTGFAMSARPLLPEVIVRREQSSQVALPLAAEGVLRYVWEGKFGSMLIEVKDGKAFVNGQAIEPAERGGAGLPLP